MAKDENLADSGMISAVTGGPVEGLLYEPRRKKVSRGSAIGFYAILLLILYFAPAALPPDFSPGLVTNGVLRWSLSGQGCRADRRSGRSPHRRDRTSRPTNAAREDDRG